MINLFFEMTTPLLKTHIIVEIYTIKWFSLFIIKAKLFQHRLTLNKKSTEMINCNQIIHITQHMKMN